ncbi:DUF116 domain-containing protein [Chloroflexota bacterium]
MAEIEGKMSAVISSERVLLLSHCLRPSQSCPGKFTKTGLDCPGDCQEDCLLRRARQAALDAGYKGVCIAAGGAMALRFVKAHHPRGIVAVACDKELVAGIEGVRGVSEGEDGLPVVEIIPLLKDGCVDTEVDEGRVLKAITSVFSR